MSDTQVLLPPVRAGGYGCPATPLYCISGMDRAQVAHVGLGEPKFCDTGVPGQLQICPFLGCEQCPGLSA